MSPSPRPKLTPARLEAFSDGVIAVIITIMVLELKVPGANGVAGMRAILPVLLVYVLSFTFTGIYWVNHHLLIDRVRRIDSRVLYANLLFLFSLSLLPFFTSWVLEKERDPLSVMIYATSLILTGATFLVLRLSIERRLRREHRYTRDDSNEARKHWLSLALYLVSIPTALRYPDLALLLDAIVTLIWILPDLGTSGSPLRHAARRDPKSRPAEAAGTTANTDSGSTKPLPTGHPQ